MNKTNSVLSIAAILSLCWAGYLAIRAIHVRATRTTDHSAEVELEKSAREIEKQNRDIESKIEVLVGQASGDAAAAIEIAATPTDLRPSAVAARMKFASFALQQELTSEQLDKLVSAIAEGPDIKQSQSIQDEVAAAIGPRPWAMERVRPFNLRLASASLWDVEKVKAAVGDKIYAALVDYLPSVAASSAVATQIQPWLTAAGVGLTPEQSSQMAQALLKANPEDFFPNRSFQSRNSTGPSLVNINQSVVEQSAGILSPAQMHVIQRIARLQEPAVKQAIAAALSLPSQ